MVVNILNKMARFCSTDELRMPFDEKDRRQHSPVHVMKSDNAQIPAVISVLLRLADMETPLLCYLTCKPPCMTAWQCHFLLVRLVHYPAHSPSFFAADHRFYFVQAYGAQRMIRLLEPQNTSGSESCWYLRPAGSSTSPHLCYVFNRKALRTH